MKKFKYLDWFFVLAGLFLILIGRGEDDEWLRIFILAFGGALIGSAISFMYIRAERNSKAK